MFNNILAVKSVYLNKKKELFNDIMEVLLEIDKSFKPLIQKTKSYLINTANENNLYYSPIFNKWLNKVNNNLIEYIEQKQSHIDHKLILSGLKLIEISFLSNSNNINDLKFNKDLLFSNLLINSSIILDYNSSTLIKLPSVSKIKIINKKIFPFFEDEELDNFLFDFDINSKVWIDELSRTLEVLRIHKPSYQLVSEFVSYIIPLKQKTNEKNLSFSARNLPSVVFKNNENNPIVFAETLVHEADHQFYYGLERVYNLWLTNPIKQKPKFYSPWRDDLRPLDGILRGLSAFTRVLGLFIKLLKTDKLNRTNIGASSCFRLLQCQIAYKVILKSKELSNDGKKFLNEIYEILNDIKKQLTSFKDFPEWSLYAEQETKEHKNKWNNINN